MDEAVVHCILCLLVWQGLQHVRDFVAEADELEAAQEQLQLLAVASAGAELLAAFAGGLISATTLHHRIALLPGGSGWWVKPRPQDFAVVWSKLEANHDEFRKQLRMRRSTFDKLLAKVQRGRQGHKGTADCSSAQQRHHVHVHALCLQMAPAPAQKPKEAKCQACSLGVHAAEAAHMRVSSSKRTNATEQIAVAAAAGPKVANQATPCSPAYSGEVMTGLTPSADGLVPCVLWSALGPRGQMASARQPETPKLPQ